MRNAITLLLGMSFLVAAPVAGQSSPPRGMQHEMHQVPDSVSAMHWYPGMGWYRGMMGMGYGGRMGPGMMIGVGLPSPGVILGMQDDLGLTDAQVSQLQSLQTSVGETVRADLTSAREAREDAASLMESQTPDLHAYQQELEEAATDQVDAQVALANASVEARGILTSEQQQKVRDGISMLHGMFRGSRAGDRAGRGMMGWNRTR